MARKLGTSSHEIIWLIVKIAVIGVAARFTRNPLEWVVIGVILWWVISQIELWSAKRYSKTHLEEAVETRLQVDKQLGREPDAVEKLVAAAPKEPTKKGKSAAQYDAELIVYEKAMRLNQIAIKKAAREKAVAWGCTEYTWMAFGTPRQPCNVARKYDGETFTFDNPPPEGHPGEGGTCMAPDRCKCWAMPSYMIAD